MTKSTVIFWAMMAAFLCGAIFGGAYFTVVMFCAGGALVALGLLAMVGCVLFSMARDIVGGVRSLFSRKAA